MECNDLIIVVHVLAYIMHICVVGLNKTMVDSPGGGAGVCAPPLNLPRGGAEGMEGGSANFFQVLNFICKETLPGHGLQVTERMLGHLFHSPKLIFYCFQRRKFWKGLAVRGIAHPLPKIYKWRFHQANLDNWSSKKDRKA